MTIERRKSLFCSSTSLSALTPLALEPRFMFDAAGVATGVEAAQDAAAQAEADKSAGHATAAPEQTADHEAGRDADALAEFLSTSRTHTGAEATGQPRTDIVVVDTSVDGYEDLLAGIGKDAEIILIDGDSQGLDDLAALLEGRTGINSVSILSHGDTGEFTLGTDTVNGETLAGFADALATIGAAMDTDGDILLYGCLVGEGGEGQAFIDALVGLTGADVAASNDLTGAANQGGDWTLEVTTGTIEASAVFDGSATNFGATLGPSAGTITFTANGVLVNFTQDPSYDNIDSTGLNVVVNTTGGSGSNLGARIAEANGTNIGDAVSGGGDPSLQIDVTNNGLGNTTVIDDVRFVSSDGGEFSISSFTIGTTIITGANSSGHVTYTITGWRDGSQVATQTYVTSSGTTSGSHRNGDVTLTSDFENVDEIRIAGVGDSNTEAFNMAFDDIVIAAAVAGNNAPTVSSAPTTVTATEDTASGLDLSATTFADADGDSLTVTLAVDAGTLAATSSGGVTVGGSGTASMTLSGTASDINTYLDTTSNIQYTGASNANGTAAATLTITPNDGTDDGTAATVDIDISAVNDDPSASGVPTDVTVLEDTASNLDLSAIALSDVDAGTGTVTFTLAASAGTMAASDGGSVTVSGSGTGTLTLSGTVANIDTYLNTASNILYTGASNASGGDAATVTLTINDGGNTGTGGGGNVSLGTVNLDITAVNDEPTLTATASNPTFTEGGSAVTAFSGTAVSTVESGQSIANMTITVTNVDGTSDETISFDGATISLVNGGSGTTDDFSSYSVVVSGGTATITFSGGASGTATIASAVDNLSYSNAGDNPTATGSTRVITITSLTDSGGTTDGGDDTASLSVASTVTVSAVNDAPAFSGLNGTPAFTEGGDAVTLDSNVTVSDIELDAADDYTGASLTIARNGGTNADDSFSFDTAGALFTVSGSNLQIGGNTFATFTNTGGTLTINFTGTGDAPTGALVDDVLQHIQYSNSNDAPPSSAQLDWTFNDGSDDATGSTTVSITGANDAPTLTATASNPSFTEGGSAASLFTGAAASTVESGQTFSGFSLTVTNVDGTSDETLTIDGTAIDLTDSNSGTTSGNSLTYNVAVSGSTATVTITGGTLSASGLQTVVNAIAYGNTDDDPTSSGSTWVVTITGLTDSGGGSDTATLSVASTVTVSAVNDDPSGATVPATASVTEDTAGNLDLSGLTLADADAGSNDVTLTLTATNGTMAASDSGGVVIGNSGTGQITLTGTISEINTYLDTASNIQYTGEANANGTGADSIAVKVNDGSNTGSGGGSDVALGTVSVDITAVNDAPTLTATAADPTFTEGGSAATLFTGAAASTVESGQTFSGLILTVTNVDGTSDETLTIDGTSVSLTDLNSGTTSGNSLTYSVSVSGSTATVTITGGTLSASGLQTVVNAIAYGNTSDDPTSSGATRLVTITGLTDSGGGSDTASLNVASTVTVSAVNDDPSATGVPSTATFTEDTAGNLDLSAISLSDADSGSGSVTLTLTAGAGTMTASSGGGVTVSGSGTGTLTLSGTVSNIDTYLNTASNIQYTGASNANGTGADSIAVTLNDGGNTGTGGGTDVDLGTISVDITAVNDTPTLTGLTDLSYTEGDSATLIDSSVSFSDPDGYDGATLVVSGLLSEDTVSVRNQGTGSGQIGFDGTNVTYEGTTIGTASGGSGASLTVTFNANASQAAVDALIQNLTYTNSADEPTASRTLAITFTDDQSASNTTSVGWSQLTGTSNPLNGFDVSSNSSVAVVDLDNDGDLDILSGTIFGTFIYYRNEGTSASPSFIVFIEENNPMNGVTIGSYSAPAFVDIDDDQDYDLFVANASGAISFYRNDGTQSSATLTEITGASNPFNGLSTGLYGAPTFVDLDNDGDYDAVIGSEDELRYYENTGTASAPTFSLVSGGSSPFSGITIASGTYAAPTFGDFDADGDYDLIVGTDTAGWRYFENTGSDTAPSFTEQTGTDNPLNGMSPGSRLRPAVGDFDNDGDLEIATGLSSGAFAWFNNVSVLNTITVTVTAINDEPTLTATGATPSFTEGGSAVSLFSAAAADTVESGQTFTGLTLTVTNVDGTSDETLTIDGTAIDLTDSNSGTTSGNSLSYSVSVSGGTATVTLSGGTVADATFESLIDNITYGNTSDDPTSSGATRVITITSLTDSGGTANGGDDTASLGIAATVSLTGVNDDPSATGLPTTLTVTEETSSGLDLSGISFSDADIQSGDITVTLSVTSGTFSLAVPDPVVATGNGTGTVTLTGTISEIETYLNTPTNTSYIGATDVAGTAAATLTISVDDNGNTGTGGGTTIELGTVDIDITGVNDAPTMTAPSSNASFTEASGTPVAIDSAITVSDVDSTTLASATVSITGNFQSGNDTLAFTNTSGMGNIAGSYNAGTGVLTLTSSGATATLAEWQAALRAVTFENDSADPGSSGGTDRTISFVLNDGTDNSSTVTQTVDISIVNDAPTSSATGADPSLAEGGSAVTLFTGTTSSTVDSSQTLTGFTLTVTNVDGTADETLTVDSTAIDLTDGTSGTTGTNSLGYSVSVSGGTATVTITGGSLSTTEFNTLVDAITYGNTGDNPTSTGTTRAIALSGLTDDGGTANGGSDTQSGNTGASTVTITPVNDAPVVAAPGSGLSYTENDSATVIDSSITVSDADNTALASATVSITGNFATGEDVLAFTNTSGMGNIAGSYNATTGVLTLTSSGASATTAEWQTALRAVTYANSSDDPSTNNRTISFVLNDGTDDSTAATQTVTVTTVNDAPSLTATATDPGFTEGGSAVTLFSGTAIETVETGQVVDSITITVSNVTNGASEVITLDGTAIGLVDGTGSTADNDLSYTVTVSSGTATIVLDAGGNSESAVQTIIDTMTYSNGANDAASTSATRTVTITSITDAGGTANGGVDTTSLSVASTVTLTDVNDEPTLTTTAANPNYTEGGSAVAVFSDAAASTTESSQTFSGFTFTVTNVDDGADETIALDGTSIAMEDGSGTTADNGLSYSVSVTSGTATVTLSGGSLSAAEFQTLLTELTYSNASDDPSTTDRVLTITSATDSGGTANSGDDTVTLSLSSTIGVNAVNDDPTGVNVPGDVTVIEDTASDLDLSAISLADADAGTGTVTLTLTASAGTMAASSGGSVTVSGSGTDTLTLTGTVANLDTYLNTASNIQYTSAANASGNNAATVTVVINDGGNTGSGGGSDVTLGTVNLDITDVNDEPTLTTTATNPTVTEGLFAGLFSTPVISTIEDGQIFTGFTLTVTNVFDGASEYLLVDGDADIYLIDGASGTTSTYLLDYTISIAGNTATVTFSNGEMASDEFESLVRTMGYGNISDNPTTDSTRVVTITSLSDNGGTSNGGNDTATLNISSTVAITAVNDAPTISAPSSSISYTENGSATAIHSGATLSDADSSTFTSATVSITDNFAAGEDVLAFTNDGSTMGNIAGSYNSTTGVLTLTSSGSTATVAEWQAAIRAVTYANSSDDPSTGDRTVSFVLNDGSDDSSAATQTISLSAENDAPTASGVPTDVTVTEDVASNFDLSAIGFADSDSAGDVTVTLAAAAGTFTASSGDDVTVSGSSTGTLTLTGTVSDINSYLDTASTIQYTSAQDAEGDNAATVAVTINDGNGSGDVSVGTVNVDITPVEDAAVVSGTFSGAATEGNAGDAAVTATGTLSISDVDADDDPSFADVGSTAGDNGFGSFALAGGTWTYTLDQSAVQDLDAGDTVTDTHTFTASDGTTQVVTVTITGTADTAVVAGTATGSVIEGDVGDTAVTASGTLTISDADADDSPSFPNVSSTAGDNGFGSFAMASGTWTYTLDQSAVQDLDAGDTVSDTHTFTASDGTTQVVTVTIAGTADAAVVTGTATGAVTEGNVGDTATATGTLAISDLDGNDNPSFANVASVAGDNGFGSFAMTDGAWTYTLDQSAVQDLAAGETATDTHTFTATDGTAQVVTITITGTEDTAVVSGTISGAVDEGDTGDTTTASGTLTISDLDGGSTPSFPDVAATAGNNGFGSFAMTSGTWTYTLDQSTVQDLDAGDTVTDTHTFTASDGTTQTVTVTITGTDDTPVVDGFWTGSVSEGNVGDAAVTASGTLSISDLDGSDSPSFANVGSTAGDNGFGSFLLSNGIWTYTLDQSAVQDLAAGDTVSDSHTFTATDGTTQEIVVTIAGTNDSPTVSGALPTLNLTENDTFSTTVPSPFSDVDDGDTVTVTARLQGGGSLPSWLSFNSATGVLSGTPTGIDSDETMVIEFVGTDGSGASVTATMTVNIEAAAVVAPPEPTPPTPPATPTTPVTPTTPGTTNSDTPVSNGVSVVVTNTGGGTSTGGGLGGSGDTGGSSGAGTPIVTVVTGSLGNTSAIGNSGTPVSTSVTVITSTDTASSTSFSLSGGLGGSIGGNAGFGGGLGGFFGLGLNGEFGTSGLFGNDTVVGGAGSSFVTGGPSGDTIQPDGDTAAGDQPLEPKPAVEAKTPVNLKPKAETKAPVQPHAPGFADQLAEAADRFGRLQSTLAVALMSHRPPAA